MAVESRRRWVLPVLLLGAGAWVIARRLSAAEPVDVWAPRPTAERLNVTPDFASTGSGVANVPTASPAARVPDPAAVTAVAQVDSAPACGPTAEAGAAPPSGTGLPAAPRPLLATPNTGATGLPSRTAPCPDGSAPGPEYTIKGNASSRLFHHPSSPYYGRTKADVWFRTADEAVAAGFSPYRARRR